MDNSDLPIRKIVIVGTGFNRPPPRLSALLPAIAAAATYHPDLPAFEKENPPGVLSGRCPNAPGRKHQTMLMAGRNGGRSVWRCQFCGRRA